VAVRTAGSESQATEPQAEPHAREPHAEPQAEPHACPAAGRPQAAGFAITAFAQRSPSKNFSPEALTETNWLSAAFGLIGFTTALAAAALTSPAPEAIGLAPDPTGLVVCMSAPFTWSGVQFGCRARSWAAIPATTGAANEVPDSRRYVPATMFDGKSWRSFEFAGAGASMYRPGATRSGRTNPSYDRPYEEKGAIRSSPVTAVSLVSAAPTTMKNGLWAGAKSAVSAPVFPEATTTVTPLNQSCSSALSSGSRTNDDRLPATSEKLATRML
jgi:hypothetical protein